MGETSKRFRIDFRALAAALAIGATGLVPAQAVAASSASAAAPLVRIDLTQDRNDFAALAAWATRYGHTLHVPGDIAKLAGLSRGKVVDITGVGYQNNSGLGVFFGVLPGRPQIIMARTDKEFTVHWFVTDGALERTIYRDAHVLKKVDNHMYDEGFHLAMAIFLTKMKQCSADATACPSPQ